MLPWLMNILCWLLAKTAPKGGCDAPRGSSLRFNPDRRFFGTLGDVREEGTRQFKVCNDAEVSHARTLRPSWQDETIDLPLRRRSKRKQAPAGDSGVTPNVTHSVTHTDRSKGAKRQAPGPSYDHCSH
jgi:hypothetical protein